MILKYNGVYLHYEYNVGLITQWFEILRAVITLYINSIGRRREGTALVDAL